MVGRARNGGDTNYRGEVDTPGWTSPVENGNTYSYEIVSRFPGGVKVTSQCGSISIEEIL